MLTEANIEAICARHAATIGMSGSGKTFTEKGYVEWLLERKRHTVIVDPLGAWWGLRSSADGEGEGYPIVIFGGEHADVEIGIWDGAAVAEIVLRDSVSCIIDLSAFRTGADQRMFMEGFVGGLRGKPKGTLNLIVDEADEFAPETVADRVGNRLKEDMVWIAKRGRMSGFILHIITQRPADIAKSVLTQCQSLTVHQLIAPQDQKPAEDWLKGNGDKATLKVVMDSLPGLETGERWVYSPKAKILDRGLSPAITTFDSSRTPEPGETLVEAKTLAQLDVSAIRGALEKEPEAVPPAARAEELEQAHLRLDDVEAQLETERRIAAEAREARARMGELCLGVVAALRRTAEDLKQAVLLSRPANVIVGDEEDGFSAPSLTAPEFERIPEFVPPAAHVVGSYADAAIAGARALEEKSRSEHGAGARRRFEEAQEAVAAIEHVAANVTGEGLSKKARDFVALLDRISPARVTWPQLAVMAGGTPSGGTFNTAKRQLQGTSLIVQDGKYVRSAMRSPTGMTRGEAVRLWREVLPAVGRTREMFDVLVNATNPMTKEEIAAAIGISPRGGNFGTSFAPLTQNELVLKNGPVFRLVTKLPGEK